jgi:hypothetical protein
MGNIYGASRSVGGSHVQFDSHGLMEDDSDEVNSNSTYALHTPRSTPVGSDTIGLDTVVNKMTRRARNGLGTELHVGVPDTSETPP